MTTAGRDAPRSRLARLAAEMEVVGELPPEPADGDLGLAVRPRSE